MYFLSGGGCGMSVKTLGIAKEISGKGKGRLYIHENLINQLEQGTEPIPY